MRTNNYALLRQGLLGYRTSKHQRRCYTTGKMSAATVIVEALIMHAACIIRMTGAHLVRKNAVILGMLIAVSDTCAQRRACRKAIEETAFDAHSVLLLTRRTQRILSGSTTRHLSGDFLFIYW